MTIDKLKPQRKQLLINASLKEFAKNGYDHASTNEIAKMAGLSKALMFHYIVNKEALYLYLLDYIHKKMTLDYD